MSKREYPINDKQKRFAQEYVIDWNATQAAIRAGYSPKTADQQASRLLTIVKVKEYIAELKSEIEERSKMKVDECVKRLTAMARFDIADFYDDNGNLKSISEIPEGSRQAISELSVFEEFTGKGSDREIKGFTKKLKLSDRRANIVELMKYLGGYEIHNKQKQPELENKNYSNLTDEEIIQLAILEKKLKQGS